MSACSRGPPIGVLGEGRDDPLRTRTGLVLRRRAAGEDPPAHGVVRDTGHRLRASDGEVSHVRRHGEAVPDPDLQVRDAESVRPEQVVHRAPLRGNEDRGDAVGAGPDGDRARLQGQSHATRVRLAGEAIQRKERHTLPVDGHLHLLTRLVPAEEVSLRRVVEHHAEVVGAVCGEVVHHRHAAPGPVRRPLDPRGLGGEPGNPVHRLLGHGVGVSDSQARHFAGGVQVGAHERRRQQLDVGDVVEVRALRVLREVVPGVDLHPQEIQHGPLVLRPVQALEHPASRRRITLGGLVDSGLQGLDEGEERIARRPVRPGRRHHAGTELQDHLLAHVRRLVGRRDVEVFEGKVAGEAPLTVAADAVVLDDVVEVRHRRSGRVCAGRRRPVGHGRRVPGRIPERSERENARKGRDDESGLGHGRSGPLPTAGSAA